MQGETLKIKSVLPEKIKGNKPVILWQGITSP